METVECSECGNRYDSQANAFCPRCGSTKTGAPMPGALALSRRNDPRRRRIQMAGVLLLVLGALTLVVAIYYLSVLMGGTALSPDTYDVVAPALGGQPGGGATLTILDNGTAAANVTLHLAAMAGNATSNATYQGAPLDVPLPGQFTNLTVSQGNRTFFRHLYAPQGIHLNVTVDLARDATGPSWVAADMRGIAMVAVGILAGVAATVVLGGIAAMRLQWYPVAVLGAALPTALSLFFALMLLALVYFLYVALFGWALVLIARGRPYFRSRKAPPGTPPAR